MYVSVTSRNVINLHACAQLGDTFMRMCIIVLAQGPLRMVITTTWGVGGLTEHYGLTLLLTCMYSAVVNCGDCDSVTAEFH